MRERHIVSGATAMESVKIQYVSGSFVAGTSASLPGVPRQMYYKTYVFLIWFRVKWQVYQ